MNEPALRAGYSLLFGGGARRGGDAADAFAEDVEEEDMVAMG